MAELLRRQSSIFEFENNHPTCMWSFLHIFDAHKRFHDKKMIAYRKQGDDSRARRSKIPKSKLKHSSIGGENDLSDSESSIMMEDKIHAAKSSGKARMKRVISKLYKKQDKQKISPLASQLFRTISIHHLECNDYVVSDELTSDSEISAVELYSHETDSSPSNKFVSVAPMGSDGSTSIQSFSEEETGHNQADELGTRSPEKRKLFKEKLMKVKEYLLKQKGNDAKQLKKDVNLNKQFRSILDDSISHSAKYVHDQGKSSPEIVLARSHSFPGAGRKNFGLVEFPPKGNDSFVDREDEPQAENSPFTLRTIKDDSHASAAISGVKVGIVEHNPGDLDGSESSSYEPSPGSPSKLKKQQRDHGTVLARFKVLKQKIKAAFKENKKEHNRISMDRVLHKIPYGKKMPDDSEKEKPISWDGSASNRDEDITKCKNGADGSVSANSKYNNRTIQRSRSLADSLHKYSRLFESISVGESKRPPERLKSIREQESNPQITWGRIFSNPEFGSFSFPITVPNELSRAIVSSNLPDSSLLVRNTSVKRYTSVEPEPVSTPLHTENNMESDTGEENTEMEDGKLVSSEYEQSESRSVSDDSNCFPPHESENITEVDSFDQTTMPGPIHSLDSCIQEEPVSLVEDSISEGNELKEWVAFDEVDPVVNDVYNNIEFENADLDEIPMPKELADCNAPDVCLDQRDDAKFNYVREVLQKSGFLGNDLVAAWYSPDKPLDPSLLTGASLSEPAKDKLDNMFIESQLLFDLINEVLLDTYASSCAHDLDFSPFCSRLRRKPRGNRLLEDVWAKIHWHLCFEPHLATTLDYIVAQDFSKHDGWMKLDLDAECIGIELEDIILDDLLDEVMLDFASLSP